MDPSAAPWRVLKSTASPDAGGAAASGQADPAARPSIASPITAAAVLGAIVLAVAAFLLASSSTGTGIVQVDGGESLAPIRGGTDSAPPADVGAQAGAGEAVVVVEIAGAVRAPGVFRLPIGSRIGDLIEAAGGYGSRLDTARAGQVLNLAARLADGDRVTVPSRDDAVSSTIGPNAGGDGEGSTTGAGGPPAGMLVDLNRATSAELEALPGIGPVTAGKIITSREEHAFAAVDDLRTRKLVGAKTFDGLKDLVAVR